MKVCIVTDASYPQINGVVRTLGKVRDELMTLGHQVVMLTPQAFRTLPCPTYPDIRLSLAPSKGVDRFFNTHRPDAIHIATEGPLGLAARRWCLREGLAFTTAYHTNFPEYISLRTRLPKAWFYAYMRWFHAPANAVMVATPTVARQLEVHGFQNICAWSRGVDTDLFHPHHSWPKDLPHDLPRPLMLNVGRVAVEKNIEAFLRLNIPGSKIVVGDGPSLATLRSRYPDVLFMGMRNGKALAQLYAAADLFVFPSKTDTFGLVMLEALASGVPVAAYPVQGPIDVLNAIGEGLDDNVKTTVGGLDNDLERAIQKALSIPPDACRNYAKAFSWRACTEQFLTNLVVV